MEKAAHVQLPLEVDTQSLNSLRNERLKDIILPHVPSPSRSLSTCFHYSWMHEISEGTENCITLTVSFLLGIHFKHWHSLWRTRVQIVCVDLPQSETQYVFVKALNSSRFKSMTLNTFYSKISSYKMST